MGKAILFCVVFFLISAAIPFTEAVIPERYSEGWLEQTLSEPNLKRELRQAGISNSLADFASENGLKLLYGRALFPRYYGSNQGIPDSDWFAYVPRDYARLGFYLVGPDEENIVLPLEGNPTIFPHAVDVIVLGCSKDGYFESRLVIQRGNQGTEILKGSQTDWICN